MSSVVTPWLHDVLHRELSRARDCKSKDGFDAAAKATPDVKPEKIDDEHSFSFQKSTQFQKYDERRYVEDGSNVCISFPHGLDGGRYLQLVQVGPCAIAVLHVTNRHVHQFFDVPERGTKAVLSDSHRAIPTTFSPDCLRLFKKTCGKPFTRDTIGGTLLIKDFEIHTTRLGLPEHRLSILVKDFHYCGSMPKAKTIGKPLGIYTDTELLKLAAQINESSGSDTSDTSPPRMLKELGANNQEPAEQRGTVSTNLGSSNLAAGCETTRKNQHVPAQNPVKRFEQETDVRVLGGVNLGPPQPSHNAHAVAERPRYAKTNTELVTKFLMSRQSNLVSIKAPSPRKLPETLVDASLPQADIGASTSLQALFASIRVQDFPKLMP